MKKNNWLSGILAIFVAMILIACSENITKTDNDPPKKKSGKIALATTQLLQSKGLAKALVAADQEVQDTIDILNFGVVRSSKAPILIVKNIGDTTIVNLEIKINNKNISMNPNVIPVLHPDASTSIMQVLEMRILHGTSIETGNYTNALLPYGENEFTIEFSGLSGGEEFYAKFNAKVTAIYIDLIPIEPFSNLSKYGEAYKYGNDSCIVMNAESGTYSPDDTLRDKISHVEWTPEGSDSSRTGLVLNKSFGELNTDCIIRQALPLSLQ